MERDPFKLFIDLVTFDQEILHANKEIDTLKSSLSLLETEALSFDTNLQAQKNLLIDAKKEVHDKELTMKELDVKEKETKHKLDAISNQKEYTLIKKEFERIQQAQHNLEPELVNSWNKLETATVEYDSKSKVIEEQIKEAATKIKEIRDKLDSTYKKIEDLYKERPQKEIDLPVEWLEKYNIMHSRVTNPVVEVVNNSCQACFFNVTNQDIINLNKKQLIQCKGCFRLLYIKSEKDLK
ncbi:MAG: hypothetical protein P4L22_07610 [Candidatus Babeliales bacterium]|nr:hypothetical protein [Candidatus Babeliales bacterium]